MTPAIQTRSVLIAGIGNIFNRDDGFGVAVAAKLAGLRLPENVRAIDFGIRGFDLLLSLLDGHDVTIFVDAVSRGGPPGSLYLIEPEMDDVSEAGLIENAHGLDPVKVLASARQMGAPHGRVIVVGCEPQTLGDDLGYLGLSEPVQAAIDPAIEMIWSILKDSGKDNL